MGDWPLSVSSSGGLATVCVKQWGTGLCLSLAVWDMFNGGLATVFLMQCEICLLGDWPLSVSCSVRYV